MTGATLGISAGFVFVVALLLVLCLRTGHHWLIKIAMVGLALFFYLLTYYSLPGFFGWPTLAHLPAKFFLLDARVDEPRSESDAGAVYLWVDSLDDGARPRSYQLPYSKELHNRITKAKARLEFGHTLAGEMESSGDVGGDKRDALPRFYFMERSRPPKK